MFKSLLGKSCGAFCRHPSQLTNELACGKIFKTRSAEPTRFIHSGTGLASGYREYFYYIDHQGMLFLDDAKIKNFTSCFKDKKFLAFFFKRLKVNSTGRHPDFPYMSLCGKEFNYVRCDDLPVVYTDVKEVSDRSGAKRWILQYGFVGDELSFPFVPTDLYVSPSNGRLYHPGPSHLGDIGLVRSSLAVELSKNLKYENDEDQSPTHFLWDAVLCKLTYKLSKNPTLLRAATQKIKT